MFKEIRYLLYLLCIFLFLFLTLNYYFSDKYEKKSYLENLNFENNLKSKKLKIPLLKNDTSNIIEYENHYHDMINQKKRKFWELIK